MVSMARMTPAKLQRLRAVEELYINGYKPKEIHGLLEQAYEVCYGTIKNDCSVIRQIWGDDLDELDALRGKQEFVARLKQLRRKAMTGWEEQSRLGPIIRGRDYRLAHEIDKEIARVSGVAVGADTRNVHLSIEGARDFMTQAMEVTFEAIVTVCTDHGVPELAPLIQATITDRLREAGAANQGRKAPIGAVEP